MYDLGGGAMKSTKINIRSIHAGSPPMDDAIIAVTKRNAAIMMEMVPERLAEVVTTEDITTEVMADDETDNIGEYMATEAPDVDDVMDIPTIATPPTAIFTNNTNNLPAYVAHETEWWVDDNSLLLPVKGNVLP